MHTYYLFSTSFNTSCVGMRVLGVTPLNVKPQFLQMWLYRTFSRFMLFYFPFFYSLCVHSSPLSPAWKTTHPESKHDLYSCATLDIFLSLLLSDWWDCNIPPACFSFHRPHSVLLPPHSKATLCRKWFWYVDICSTKDMVFFYLIEIDSSVQDLYSTSHLRCGQRPATA